MSGLSGSVDVMCSSYHQSEEQKNLEISQTFLVIVYTLSVVILLFNISVIVSTLRISKNNKFRVTYLFLSHLAVTNALTGAVLLFGAMYPHQERTYNFCLIYLGKYRLFQITENSGGSILGFLFSLVYCVVLSTLRLSG